MRAARTARRGRPGTDGAGQPLYQGVSGWTSVDGDGEPVEVDTDEDGNMTVAPEHNEFATNAARYLIVLGILAQAEGSPLQIELDKKTRWRHVRLGERSRGPRGNARPSAPRCPVHSTTV